MRLFSFMFCCLSAGVVLAADVVGSQDLEVLPRFARAEIIEFSQNSGQERVLPTGPLSRISGKLRIESQVRAEGQLTALTYALPAGHTALDVFNAARNQVQANGAELLYWCQGRDCGSSSLWANSVFANAQLYGSDDQQAYALLRLAAPQQDSLLVLYAITRGNRRAYLHVEQLNASAPLGTLLPSPNTLLEQLKSNQRLSLPNLPATPDATWSALLARSLNMDSTLRVSLAGVQAEAWRAALVSQGVRSARLTAQTNEEAGLVITLRAP